MFSSYVCYQTHCKKSMLHSAVFGGIMACSKWSWLSFYISTFSFNTCIIHSKAAKNYPFYTIIYTEVHSCIAKDLKLIDSKKKFRTQAFESVNLPITKHWDRKRLSTLDDMSMRVSTHGMSYIVIKKSKKRREKKQW